MIRYLAAAFAARLADAMWVAPVLLVLDRTGSATLAGLALSAATLPTLVTAPLIGAWLDAHPHRRAAIAVNQVLLAGALAVLIALGHGALVVACTGAAGLTQPLVTGGFSSMVPALGGEAAWDAMTYNVANIAGPALAGTLAAALGPAAAVGAQAAVALAGLAFVLTLPAKVDVGRRAPLLGTLRAGLSHIVREPRLRAVTLITVVTQLAWGVMSVAAPALALRLGSRASSGGLLLAAVAVGGLAGAAALPRLRARHGLLGLVAGATLAEGAGLAALAAAPDLATGLLAAALTGVPQGLATAAMLSARGQWSPAHLHSQVFTSAAGLRTAVYALGAAAAGPVLESGGARLATLAAAATCAAVSAPRAVGSRRPAGRSAG